MVRMRITIMNWALFTVYHFGAVVTESRAAELRKAFDDERWEDVKACQIILSVKQ